VKAVKTTFAETVTMLAAVMLASGGSLGACLILYLRDADQQAQAPSTPACSNSSFSGVALNASTRKSITNRTAGNIPRREANTK